MMNNSSNSVKTPGKDQSQAQCSTAAKAYHQMEGVVEDRPLSAVMLSFGLGLGVGLAVGSMIAAATYTEPKTRMAERMGQQFLDALMHVVPSSVSQRFAS